MDSQPSSNARRIPSSRRNNTSDLGNLPGQSRCVDGQDASIARPALSPLLSSEQKVEECFCSTCVRTRAGVFTRSDSYVQSPFSISGHGEDFAWMPCLSLEDLARNKRIDDELYQKSKVQVETGATGPNTLLQRRLEKRAEEFKFKDEIVENPNILPAMRHASGLPYDKYPASSIGFKPPELPQISDMPNSRARGEHPGAGFNSSHAFDAHQHKRSFSAPAVITTASRQDRSGEMRWPMAGTGASHGTTYNYEQLVQMGLDGMKDGACLCAGRATPWAYCTAEQHVDCTGMRDH